MAAGTDTHGKALTAGERWDSAVKSVYASSTAGQKKSAPRGAFVGLCEAGLVKGIIAVVGRVPGKNGDYAIEAVRLLKAGEHKTVTQLWAAVADQGKAHDSQMDVVLALWKNGWIV